MPATRNQIEINRAPVLTLWATVVAQRLAFKREEALTLGRAVAGLNAYSKGLSLGLFEPTPKGVRDKRLAMRSKQTITVSLLHRAVPAVHTKDGLRALSHEKPIDPESVDRYLLSKFGDKYKAAYDAMMTLAKSIKPAELASRAYGLYEKFRPEVPRGTKGWGAMGILDLSQNRKMSY